MSQGRTPAAQVRGEPADTTPVRDEGRRID
jgi:hypothetical protein